MKDELLRGNFHWDEGEATPYSWVVSQRKNWIAHTR